MLIFFQELVVLIFLWLLKMIDGIMEIFSAISGITDVSYKGENVNIIEFLVSNSTVDSIFWCLFILSVGLTCIFAIYAIIKNMLTNQRALSTIVGKIFLSMLGTLAMLAVATLMILIVNAILVLIAEIFQIGNTTKLSNAIFNACVGDWLNGYSVSEFNVNTTTVEDILGTYKTGFVFPEKWKYNGMVNPDTFMYLPSMIASIGLIIALIVGCLNLAKRVYEIIFLYLVMPLSMSTLSLDDGARFKVWRETFFTKLIVAYGTVFSVNIFTLILPLISGMRINGISNFGNSMFLIFMILGGAFVIPSGQMLFARLFGQAEDMSAGGHFLSSAFYGARMVGGATFGLAKGLTHGGKGIYKMLTNRKHNSSSGGSSSNSGGGGGNKYTQDSPTNKQSNLELSSSSRPSSGNQYRANPETISKSSNESNGNQYKSEGESGETVADKKEDKTVNTDNDVK